MTGTLRDDQTTAAIVVGWKVGFEEWSVDPDELGKLDKAVDDLNAARGLDFKLFVPGDTCTNWDDSTSGTCIIGRRVLSTYADDGSPHAFEAKTVRDALAALPELDEQYFATIGEGLDGFEGADGGPASHLISWGPLCYAALHIGVPMAESDRDSARYKYAANQNMEQEWSANGLDGQHLTSSEFSDVGPLDFSEDAFADHVARVPDLDNPTYFLLCRYD